MNDIKNPDLIRRGQKLTVVEGPFRVEVRKNDRSLIVCLGDSPIRSYRIAVGAQNSTPEGDYTVLRKMVKPPWTDPYNRTIMRAEDPNYPLGSRWIEFKAPPGAYGIHGTNNVEDLGKEVSFGCIRVLHPQEEEIYDFVVVGSPVVVLP